MRYPGLVVLVFMIASLLPGCSPGFHGELRSQVSSYEFSLARWVLITLIRRVKPSFTVGGLSHEEKVAIVGEFFTLVGQAKAYRQHISQEENEAKRGTLQEELLRIQEKKAELENKVERILEEQIRGVLQGQGVYHPWFRRLPLRVFFPPPRLEIDPAPYLLVISPRERIIPIAQIILKPDIDWQIAEDLENRIENKFNVSALVTDRLSGLATFPILIADDRGLRTAIRTIADEWTHHYLFFAPLGRALAFDFYNYDLRTVNETVACIVAEEVTDLVIQKYYSHIVDEEEIRAQDERQDKFHSELRIIKKVVNEYLLQGKIDEAEKFMEDSRLGLLEKGFYVRKLNQAFFARRAPYISTPVTVNPLAEIVKEIRKGSPDLGEFLKRMAQIVLTYDTPLKYNGAIVIIQVRDSRVHLSSYKGEAIRGVKSREVPDIETALDRERGDG